MPFDPAPTNLIASWSEDGTDVTFPIASVPELSATEADALTGDSRKVAYALVKQVHDYLAGLASADAPAKIVSTMSDTVIAGTGNLRRRFVMEFDIGGALDVIDE